MFTRNYLYITSHIVKYLIVVFICWMILPLRASELTSGQSSAMNLSQAEIQARIRELEAERDTRLAAMKLEDESMSSTFIPGNLEIWFIGLSSLLAISIACLLWIAMTMRQLKKTQRQPKSKAPPSRGKSVTKPIFRWIDASFDPIEYENVTVLPLKTKHDIIPKRNAYTSQAAKGVITPEDGIEFNFDFDPALSSPELIQVTEDIRPLHQAQFWAALNKPEIAIDILEQSYKNDATPNSWLLLLNLYAKNQQYKKYEGLQPCVQMRFNINVPPWQNRLNSQFERHLRDMPDLAQRINRMLPSNGVIIYLNGLLFDNRNGTRRGFDYGVYCDLMCLFDAVCEGRMLDDCTSAILQS